MSKTYTYPLGYLSASSFLYKYLYIDFNLYITEFELDQTACQILSKTKVYQAFSFRLPNSRERWPQIIRTEPSKAKGPKVDVSRFFFG